MKLDAPDRTLPVVLKIHGQNSKDCVACCVSTITGAMRSEIDHVYQTFRHDPKKSAASNIRTWIDLVNEELRRQFGDIAWQMSGPHPEAPLGLSIAIIQPASLLDPAPHAVVVRRAFNNVPFVVHDPGFAPYDFDPEVFYFLQLNLDREHRRTIGFTEFAKKTYSFLTEKVDETIPF